MRAAVLLVLAAVVPVATADIAEAKGGRSGYHYVAPYTTSKGTHVQGHYQTDPNGTRADNWSTRGNVNPMTGKPGTKPLHPLHPVR